MNRIPYMVFLIVFFVRFLAGHLHVLPGAAILLFELTSGAIFLIALVYAAVHKSLSVSPKYLILFLALCLHFMAGAIINYMDPAVVFSGLRIYMKYMPLFLLPLVYRYSDDEIKGQMKFLVALGLLQFPVLLMEKYILGWGTDHLAGTLGIGSIMSIFLVCSIVVLAAFYFRERITAKAFLLLAFFLFIPTTLNESKSTMIFTVIGLLVVMLGGRLKKAHIVAGAGALATMLVVFIAVYGILFGSHGATAGKGLYSFIAEPDSGIKRYLFSGDSISIEPNNILDPPSSVIGAMSPLEAERFDDEVFRSRRIDQIIFPIRVLSEDPAKLLLGVGIGNASTSKVNLFAGQYSSIIDAVAASAMPYLLWETGILGVFLYLIFFYFIYRDARFLSRTDALVGALALGWTGVVAIIILTLPYKNIFIFESLCALFWYLSGHVAAERFRLEKNWYGSQREK